MAVLAGEFAVDAVVGAHDSAGVGDSECNLERAQVCFAHRPLADVYVERISATLLVIDSEMLQIANDVFGLDAANEVADHRAGEQGIFSLIFEGAAAARLARQVYSHRPATCCIPGPEARGR